MTALPSDADVRARLRQILGRGSVNLGPVSGIERLMLMLTRSCQLRCGYCFVNKSESLPSMPQATARRSIDLLMRSERPRLEVQLFGGEPTSRWEELTDVVRYASEHEKLGGRDVSFVVTTNGAALTPERLAFLADYPVTVLLSLDGDAAVHRKHRPVYRGGDATWAHDDTTTYSAIDDGVAALLETDIRWFANIVLPPSAADQVMARYEWAKQRGIPRLQLNYAVGMLWSPEPTRAYLDGLATALRSHHADPGTMQLFNWKSDCEPVMLSDDLIVDVDGHVYHDGAIFLERAFAELRTAYYRGHLDELEAFDPLRWSLSTLFTKMVESYPKGARQRRIILQNAWLGAAVDLMIQRLAVSLGRDPSRGAA